MADSFRALCSDFYVNHKLSVKLELPRTRETVLELFERVRKRFPGMTQFRRYRDELALETAQNQVPQRWLAVREASIRAGAVNPDQWADAYALHRHVLEVVPYFLTISPLDVEFVELLYGFDLECSSNHDAVIYDALLSGAPMGELLDIPDATPVDCQPLLAVAIGEDSRCEAQVEVKSRSSPESAREGAPEPVEPISIYLTVRRMGPFESVSELPATLDDLAERGEDLVEQRVVEKVIVPLRDAIGFERG